MPRVNLKFPEFSRIKSTLLRLRTRCRISGATVMKEVNKQRQIPELINSRYQTNSELCSVDSTSLNSTVSLRYMVQFH